ncbi:MAG: hypothetical protein K2W95_20765 [Candidatus Obscuribacterales bacterium]|nr:hypothetical protein [Candidatus Obscuribacterales bacterium]
MNWEAIDGGGAHVSEDTIESQFCLADTFELPKVPPTTSQSVPELSLWGAFIKFGMPEAILFYGSAWLIGEFREVLESPNERALRLRGPRTPNSAALEELFSGASRSETKPVPQSQPVERAGALQSEGSPQSKPVERPVPPRDSVPTADRLQSVAISANADGTLRVDAVRSGELINVAQLRTQTEVTAEAIGIFERELERLKNSGNRNERERTQYIEEFIRTLKGAAGPEARASAHAGALEQMRREVNLRSRAGGAVGASIGAGIILTACMSWYLSQRSNPSSPINRASVGGS